ncbi:capsule biosynthesis GfcC family protein [Vibrio scophthalmi]|uniref:capsule biosynthesis GfcC family protein n=1 Tax=Vibrio scophthalmi TaxID=45658 RepID=UPI0009F65809|nr:capsule biosynthesis GfcC family protein [Vibrio scophthalmi]
MNMTFNSISKTKVIPIALWLTGTASISPSFANALTINIPQEEIKLEYSQPVRLEQVFADVISQSNRNTTALTQYAVGNKLFNIDKQPQSQQLKQQVINELQSLAAENSANQASVDILVEQIKSWNVGYREELTLDLDHIRIQPQANPMLNGHFELVTTTRTPQFSIEGLLTVPQSIELGPDKTLSHYLEPLAQLSSAHPSYAWVVYPDGHYKRVGYAYWNNENTALIPGTVVFLGYNSDSASTLELEERIVKLISMRTSTK